MSPNAPVTRAVGVVVLGIAVAGAVVGAPVRDGPAAAPGDVANSAVESGGVGSPDAGRSGTGRGPSFTALAPAEGVDDVEVVVRVAADRSAEWRVHYRYRLRNGTATTTFQRALRNVTNPPGVFVERMRDAARRGEQRTGREMRVLNGSVSAYTSVPHGRFGVVEYRITWTGFAARRDDGRLVAGDLLDSYPIDDNESLVFGWTASLRMVEVRPPPNATRESTVRWNGPHDFGVEQPRLVLARGGDRGIVSTVTDPLVMAAVGGLLGVVAVVAVATGVGLDRLRSPFGGGTGAGEGDGGAGEDGAPPAELLSDRERVLRLLEDNGGRLKQQDVKEAFDWSRTKTSNVVNDLREDGQIEVYRIGRENTLALPDEMDI